MRCAFTFRVCGQRPRRRAKSQSTDVFYDVTLMNENYAQPDLPAGVDAAVLRRLLVVDADSIAQAATKSMNF